MSNRLNTRKKSYKTGVDVVEARRRREDDMVEIRRRKREDGLSTKRRIGPSLAKTSSFTYSFSTTTGKPFVQIDNYLESLGTMVKYVHSGDIVRQWEATTWFANLLSIGQNPPYDMVVDAGVIPYFVEFLSRHDLPKLQFEAARVLANVAAGTTRHTQVLIENDAVPRFVKLLSSGSEDVREQAVCALGNIAAESPDFRDVILLNGGLTSLLSLFSESSRISIIKNATWALCKFCQGKPPAPFDLTKPALQVLQHLVHSSDFEVLTNACWALSYLSHGTTEKIQAVIESGICPRLVELLLHPSTAVLIPALRTVGNIVSGDDDNQTQVLVNNGVLSRLDQLLREELDNNVKNEVCWTISNITAGSREQIQAVIDANVVQTLVQHLHCAVFDVKKEAAWAIANATRGSHDQIHFLVSQQCIEPLCELLLCPDTEIVRTCLEGLDNILKVGEVDKDLGKNGGVNLYAHLVCSCGGLEKIENLTCHNNSDIYEKSTKMLRRYWAEDDKHAIQEDGGLPGLDLDSSLN